MKNVCQISCCHNESDNLMGITYHKFPKVVAERWFSINNIPTRPGVNSFEMLVCSDHFKPQDYVDTDFGAKLKSGAIPSLYLKIPKKTATQPNPAGVIVPWLNNVDDAYVANNTVSADQNAKINIQMEISSAKGNKLEGLVHPKNGDSARVDQFTDKDIELKHIIIASNENDTCTVINAMHNYSAQIQIKPLIVEESESKLEDLLKRQLLAQTATQASPLRSRRKLLNKWRFIELTRQKVIIPRRHRRNMHMASQQIADDIENVSLDHDYSSFVEELHFENIDDRTSDKDTYDLMCSENYVWRLRKQIDVYTKKTKMLRRKVDALKNVVKFLKNRL